MLTTREDDGGGGAGGLLLPFPRLIHALAALDMARIVNNVTEARFI
ncbi:Hypothetical protein Bdt_2990 [Bdellovibrio bacteriovorus str. Tiberius]|uniref:Uncharacterized protein n=1 Tax=Bdellovibrio bacteriovorus str. Tiberius TaxID=1069642 RepID=K7Z0U6_BDEBC|nr:Hypothetical protein Bdt_2990 [Bdellovibrio bacteriovorus str. Tiberius]